MQILHRRGLIGGVLALAATPAAALAAPANGTLRFNVYRNRQAFGQYSVAFATVGDTLTVTTNVAMRARIAGVTVFDYQHRCRETWQAGRFLAMQSNSIRDNQVDLKDAVTAIRGASGINVTDEKGGLSVLPPNAHPLTHWNPAALTGPLFNPQTGQRLRLTASPLGRSAFPLASGASVTGAHWRLTGETQIEEWYDDAGNWIGLRGLLPDRSVLEYRRV